MNKSNNAFLTIIKDEDIIPFDIKLKGLKIESLRFTGTPANQNQMYKFLTNKDYNAFATPTLKDRTFYIDLEGKNTGECGDLYILDCNYNSFKKVEVGDFVVRVTFRNEMICLFILTKENSNYIENKNYIENLGNSNI